MTEARLSVVPEHPHGAVADLPGPGTTETRDPLTGLANRTLLLERIEHALLRGRRSKTVMAVILADLNASGTVDNVYGHGAVDILLGAAAERLTGLLRSGDTVARLSGGHFVILCEDLDEVSQADVIVRRVTDALARPFTLGGVAAEIAADVRVAFAGLETEMPKRLLDRPERATGDEDRQRTGDGRRQRPTESRATLERDLHGAARRGELRCDYQPIVDAGNGLIVGVEALLRWDHPTRGLIAPTTLIPLAEASRLIVDIGRWTLERACRDRHRWVGATGRDRLGIWVNVSAQQLLAPDFVEMVTAVLQGTHTVPEQLTLEITEHLFVEGRGGAVPLLEQCKQLGVNLALDDFGTGNSSLQYLERFPVDVVKLDPRSVANLVRDKAGLAVVSAITGLAHELGMIVVAEGVETAAQHRGVAAVGVDWCQGHYFAWPMSADDLDGLTTTTPDVDLRLPLAAASPSSRDPVNAHHPELFLP